MKNFIFLVIVTCLTACSQPAYGKRPSSQVPIPMSPMTTTAKAKGKPLPPASFLLKPELQTKIILDPGHGGKDLGTFSKKNTKYQEKTITLATSKLVKNYLENMGYNVTLTRTRDVFVALDKRAEFANNLEPELFVSIHFNSAPNKQAEGIEIFYYRTDTDKKRSALSKILAENVLKEILNETGAKSRGVKHGNLAVIRETTMPAVLVEGGFLTNENEVVKIKDQEYLEKIALGIANGIHSYVKKKG